ncbi:MAG TPA: hypothetical protein VFA46_11150 [Actinomycetes bacterium]|nr:hypothetical protein [Actinomycetes bacterium]
MTMPIAMLLGATVTWLYNSTGRSVLLVGLFHACFDAAVTGIRQFISGPDATAALLGSSIVIAIEGRTSMTKHELIRALRDQRS